MTGAALAAAAEALDGAPFRLHGRNPETGVDCVGVLALALKAIGRPAPLPLAYAIRARSIPALADIVRACGFKAEEGTVAPGDVILVRPAPCQFHLLVATHSCRFVHAHAGLGRVLIGPVQSEWKTVGHWRLDEHFRD